MLPEVFVALGSNLGDSLFLLDQAVNALRTHPAISDLAISSYYQTKPLSDIPQSDFINAVCRFKTELSPLELLYNLQEIEKSLGKIEKPKNAPRPIDLDILMYGNLQMCTKNLEIPHPRWKERLFVICPLAELTDDPIVHSLLKRPFAGQELPKEIKRELS